MRQQFTRWSLHFFKELSVLETTHCPLTFKLENTFFCPTEFPKSPPENALLHLVCSSLHPTTLSRYLFSPCPIMLSPVSLSSQKPLKVIYRSNPSSHWALSAYFHWQTLPQVFWFTLNFSDYCWNILYFTGSAAGVSFHRTLL